EPTLLDDIAEFFWNNGNEVYSRSHFDSRKNYRHILKCCEGIVFLIHKEYPAESSFLERAHKVFQWDDNFGKSIDKKFKLFFTRNGVYSNAIPSPHKVFHFEKLCKDELTSFFLWCEQLNLFTRSPSQPAYQNFLFL